MVTSLSVQENLNRVRLLKRLWQESLIAPSEFEDRLQLLTLDFALTDLVYNSSRACPLNAPQLYVIYLGPSEWRYAPASNSEQIVTEKLKQKANLTDREKSLMMALLRRLSSLPVPALDSTLKEI